MSDTEFKKMIIDAIHRDPLFAKTLAGAICNNLNVESSSISIDNYDNYAVEHDTIEINSRYFFNINIEEKLKSLNISDVSRDDIQNLEFFINFLYESYQTYITEEEILSVIDFILKVKALKDDELKSYLLKKQAEINHNEIKIKDFLESVNI